MHDISTDASDPTAYGGAVRRDLLYLGAMIVNTALVITFGLDDVEGGPFILFYLAAALGPAWLLRRGSLRPVLTAPLMLVVLIIGMPLVFDLLGADCPQEGMDT